MNREILGYGEDSLTLFFLRNRWKEFTEELRAQVKHAPDLNKKSKIFYRLSLGRGAKGIGELDAVIVVPGAALLLESKWDNNLERNISKIRMDAEQWQRDMVMRELILKESGKGWNSWKRKFEKKYRPRSEETTLKNNLEAFLRVCKDEKVKKVFHILLFFQINKRPGINKIEPIRNKPDFDLKPSGKTKFNLKNITRKNDHKKHYTLMAFSLPKMKEMPAGFISL
jgi:hypothetical protein